MDEFTRFEEPSLPSQPSFCDDLNQKDISTEEYALAQEVWDAFECKNLWHYCGVYLASDVLTLADVFMTFVEDILDL